MYPNVAQRKLEISTRSLSKGRITVKFNSRTTVNIVRTYRWLYSDKCFEIFKCLNDWSRRFITPIGLSRKPRKTRAEIWEPRDFAGEIFIILPFRACIYPLKCESSGCDWLKAASFFVYATDENCGTARAKGDNF
jgi:hypothetical protein